jgi:hypothetical protein
MSLQDPKLFQSGLSDGEIQEDHVCHPVVPVDAETSHANGSGIFHLAVEIRRRVGGPWVASQSVESTPSMNVWKLGRQ